MKIGMVSLGCPKNQTDAEIMLGILADKGHIPVADPAEAEVIIVNTCGFIDPAKQESIDAVLEMAEYKESGNCRLLIMTGCLAERYHEEVKKELPEVDAIVGAGDFDKIGNIVKLWVQACHCGVHVFFNNLFNQFIHNSTPFRYYQFSYITLPSTIVT